MAKKQEKKIYSNTEIRKILLQYFYEKNKSATSQMGKKSGAAVMISVVRADLKAAHGLKAQEVVGNLTYLLSQGWVEAKTVSKSWTKGGVTMPATTSYYIITAPGIDKIEGPSEFTRDRFHGVKIEATGQNIITVGDGNQVNIKYKDAGEALSGLGEAIKASTQIAEEEKLEYIADIESMQSQLAKPTPNKSVLKALWEGIEKVATFEGLASAATRVASILGPFLS